MDFCLIYDSEWAKRHWIDSNFHGWGPEIIWNEKGISLSQNVFLPFHISEDLLKQRSWSNVTVSSYAAISPLALLLRLHPFIIPRRNPLPNCLPGCCWAATMLAILLCTPSSPFIFWHQGICQGLKRHTCMTSHRRKVKAIYKDCLLLLLKLPAQASPFVFAWEKVARYLCLGAMYNLYKTLKQKPGACQVELSCSDLWFFGFLRILKFIHPFNPLHRSTKWFMTIENHWNQR